MYTECSKHFKEHKEFSIRHQMHSYGTYENNVNLYFFVSLYCHCLLPCSSISSAHSVLFCNTIISLLPLRISWPKRREFCLFRMFEGIKNSLAGGAGRSDTADLRLIGRMSPVLPRLVHCTRVGGMRLGALPILLTHRFSKQCCIR